MDSLAAGEGRALPRRRGFCLGLARPGRARALARAEPLRGAASRASALPQPAHRPARRPLRPARRRPHPAARDQRRAQPRPRPDRAARQPQRPALDAGTPADLPQRRRPHRPADRRSLHFTDVGSYFGGSYWKVHQLAHFELWSVDGHHRLCTGSAAAPSSITACATSSCTRPGSAHPASPTIPAATRTPTKTASRSAPRSAGPTSTRPTTRSSGSRSAACAAASPS